MITRTTDPDATLLDRAKAVLDAGWRGRSTVPSPALYPHQWSWDSGFIAVGRSWYDQARAQQELETLFEGQWANGMVPHIVFNPEVDADAYFPGPDFWQSWRAAGCPDQVATSGITQPPVHARAALEVYEQASDRADALAFLRRMYPKLALQDDYLARYRDAGGNGLAAVVHPWESGLDNSPLWDASLAELVIPPGGLPPYRRRDLVHADPKDRPSDAAYDRFVYLAASYRGGGYDDTRLTRDSPFLVEAPLFNAVWLWSVHALAEIADLIGADPAPHLAQAARIHDGLLADLWDEPAGRFSARELRGGRLSSEQTVSCFAPLLDPDLPGDILERVVAQLRSACFGGTDPKRYVVPSYDLGAAGFDPRQYWRGPVWINTNWLVWRGLLQHGQTELAARVAGSITDLPARSGFREYFDPNDGTGYGSDGFAWSAALLIDRLCRAPQPAAQLEGTTS